MNRSNIEWTNYTWNPVTGCLHGCPYCYAAQFARRFGEGPLEDRFKPRFHPERLKEPQTLKKPSVIFVVSAGDLFGRWVSTSWIMQVFDACLAAPQHTYLFLTKNPERYNELCKLALLPIDENFWYGSTVTTQEDVKKAKRNYSFQTFWSCEPLHGPIGLQNLHPFQYPQAVIVGAETGNRKGKIEPEWDWVASLAAECGSLCIPVFAKDNLRRLYPGLPESDPLPWY